MMLHGANHHFIFLIHKKLSKGGRQQIKRFRSASCKHNLLWLFGVDEERHCLARVFVSLCRHLAEIMHPSVYVAVLTQIVIALAFNHAKRFLSGRGVVEIYKRLSVNLLVQHRELPPNLVYVEIIQNRKI